MIFGRRFYGKLAEGASTSLSDLDPTLWTVRDVEPNVELIVPTQENQAANLATVTSSTLALPDGYVNTDRLFAVFQTNGVIKVTVTKPDTTTSVVLVNGSSTVNGLYSFTQKVTSIVINNPTAATVRVKYLLFPLPNLNSSDSFRGTYFTYGIYQPT